MSYTFFIILYVEANIFAANVFAA
jgi:hypothetical protein